MGARICRQDAESAGQFAGRRPTGQLMTVLGNERVDAPCECAHRECAQQATEQRRPASPVGQRPGKSFRAIGHVSTVADVRNLGLRTHRIDTKAGQVDALQRPNFDTFEVWSQSLCGARTKPAVRVVEQHHTSTVRQASRPTPTRRLAAEQYLHMVSQDQREVVMLGAHPVRRIGLGCMRLASAGAMGGAPRPATEAIATLRRAIELSVNHLDTAQIYFHEGGAVANQLIREGLAPYPEDLVIATKIGAVRDRATGEWLDWANPSTIRQLLEADLAELGVDRLPVAYYRHHGRGPIGPNLEALAALRDEGLIESVGISAITQEEYRQARTITDIVAVQNRHEPGAQDFISECARDGVAYVPFFSIVGADQSALAQLERKYDATPAQLGIAATLALSPNVLAIPGTGNPQHLEENLAAGALSLDPDDLARLT